MEIEFGLATGQLDPYKEYALAYGSVSAMISLGPQAVDAIPLLTTLLNNPKASSPARQRAVVTLAGLGNAGLPPLLSAVTNKQWIAKFIVYRFGMLRTNGRVAIPTLERLL